MKVQLVFCVHNHQPVGHFEQAFEEAYRRAYGPFLQALERHPRATCALHYSGVLLDWFEARHPEHLERLRALIRRGQVEPLAGAHYEPILAAIPEGDRIEQVSRLRQTIERLTGVAPTTLWLAEGAWEPHLPPSLRAAGVEAVVLEGACFERAGLAPGRLTGYYLTEDQGEAVALFPASDRLRAAIPSEAPERALEEIRRLAADGDPGAASNAVVCAVDGERLSLAPGPGGAAGEEGWPERFCRALEGARDWLEVVTFAEHRARAAPRGRLYLPGGSGEASWRSALATYPEANALHKKMLRVSRKVGAAARHDPARGAAARDALHRAQCNEPYRGGARGGLLLPHLRSTAYRNLVAAETVADGVLAGCRAGPLRAYPWGGEVRGACAVEAADLDADGEAEVAIESPAAALLLAPAAGGALVELDVRARSFNLLDTVGAAPGRRRSAFLDHFLSREADLGRFASGAHEERGRFCGARYEWILLEPPPVAESEIPADPEPEPPRVRMTRRAAVQDDAGGGPVPVVLVKTFRHDGDRAAVSVAYLVQNEGRSRLETTFCVELTLNLLAGDAPDRYFRIPGVELPPEARRLGSRGATPGVTAVELVDEWLPLTARLEWDEPAELWRFPAETLSPAPGGADRTFQGSTLLLRWPLALGPDGRFRVRVELSAS